MTRVTNQRTRQYLLVTGDPMEDTEILERIQLFNEEGAPLMIGGSYTRAQLEYETPSLAADAENTGVLTVAPGWRAFVISTDKAARVRIYKTAAQRDADLGRSIGTRPMGNHGRLLEVVTLASMLEVDLSPTVDFMSEVGGSDEFYIAVQNRSGSTGTVVTTIDYVRTE